MGEVLIFDIETDGFLLQATQIFVLAIKNIDESDVDVYTGNDIKHGISRLQKADKIIAHNGLLFDIPCIKRLYDIDLGFKTVVDTILISRLMLPDRDGGHSLDAWGKRLGFHKGDFKDFSKLTDEMIEYCKQDVRVTERLYKKLRIDAEEYMPKIIPAIQLEHEFAYIISKQILTGFQLNVDKVTKLYHELQEEAEALHNTLQNIMPKVPDLSFLTRLKKENIITLTETSCTYIQDKTRKIVTKEIKFDYPNPTSRQQIVKFLKDEYHWVPQEFTEKGSPKIDEKILNALTYPVATMFARLFRLQKQMGMIKSDDGGWLNYVNKETNRVHGNVLTNATNTGRCSHSSPNLAQVDKKDIRMREVWEAADGYKLVGVDAASLELRVLSHYLAPFDHGVLAHEVTNGDVHTHNKELMGLQDRNSAKTAIYALIYGAGNQKLGTIYAADQQSKTRDEIELKKMGSVLRSRVEENFLGYKTLCDTVQKALAARGYLVGLDGRPLHPRSDYSALNLLIQSAGAIIMKKALVNFYNSAILKYKEGIDFKLVANVHDEAQMESLPGIAEELKDLFVQSIRQVTKDFELKCSLDGEGRIGSNWAETH